LCKLYGIDYVVFKTTGKNDDNNLKTILDEVNPDKVVSVGGDGTTLFTSIVLLNSKYPMGIIPLGSANGMSTELFVNPNPMEALRDIIMSEVIGELDMVVVNDEYHSIHIGDVGVNAQIVNSYEKDKHRGMTTYTKYFIKELSHMTPIDITIQANGEEVKVKGVMIGICNSRKYGTGITLNLNGNPMDGKFEIVVLKKINASALIKSSLTKFDEHFYNNKNKIVISTTEAEIHFEQPNLLQLDGEVIGEFSDLKVKILPGAVKIITHNNNRFLQ
jgi:diacylglycerol kinase family enzyme